MPKEVDDEKIADPGMAVTVSLPALIMSGSTSASCGYGPMPSNPFSDCSLREIRARYAREMREAHETTSRLSVRLAASRLIQPRVRARPVHVQALSV
jgi:hypothetical protein